MWAFAILLVFCACRHSKNTTVPVDLIGVWKTPEPTYADRHFEITKDTLSFGTGEGRIDSHPILSIEEVPQVPQGAEHFYIISYADNGQKSVFSFHLNNGVIRIKNQKALQWTKQRR